MTDIKIYRDRNGEISKFIVSGHTGFSESGTDIVCASVTTTAVTALNGLTDVVGLTVGYEVRDGYLECILPAEMDEKSRFAASVLLDSMFLTFRELQEQYDEYISITELEV
jgi:uncharacterized protein YsxB (DUF464 family)